jgi:hypothetical protein
MTLAEIRKDLKEIRYYYSRKELLDKAFNEVGTNSVLNKVRKYNAAVNTAPPRLYDLYISLYVNNSTQENLAADLNYTPEYIQMQNKKLLLFLQSELND